MLLTVGSVKGSPGATTAALALAGRWPGGGVPIVVEADPAGGDLLARFELDAYPGMVSLAAAARRTASPRAADARAADARAPALRSAGAELLWQHTQRLPGGLPVVVGAMGGEQAKAALAALAASGGTAVLRDAADAADAARAVVIVDCGRVDPASAAAPIIRAADAMVVVVRPRADELAHLATLLPTLTGWCATVWLVRVGDGYPPRDIERELQVPVLGSLPDDPKGAAALAGRPGVRNDLTRSALGGAAARVAAVLQTHLPRPTLRPVDIDPVRGGGARGLVGVDPLDAHAPDADELDADASAGS